MTLQVITSNDDSEVTETLRHAISEHYKTVIVFGLDDDRDITIHASSIESNTLILGALEMAKMQIFANSKG